MLNFAHHGAKHIHMPNQKRVIASLQQIDDEEECPAGAETMHETSVGRISAA